MNVYVQKRPEEDVRPSVTRVTHSYALQPLSSARATSTLNTELLLVPWRYNILISKCIATQSPNTCNVSSEML